MVKDNIKPSALFLFLVIAVVFVCFFKKIGNLKPRLEQIYSSTDEHPETTHPKYPEENKEVVDRFEIEKEKQLYIKNDEEENSQNVDDQLSYKGKTEEGKYENLFEAIKEEGEGISAPKINLDAFLNEEVDRSKLKRRLPKALVAGFSKCGSYALISFLKFHPHIEGPDAELDFFRGNYAKGIDWYQNQMPLSMPNQITIEKSPSYVKSKIALPRIHEFNSSIKLIVTVRDPVVLFQSGYGQEQSRFPDPSLTFDRYIEELILPNLDTRIGYASAIRNAYETFSRQQVHVVSEEATEKNPSLVLRGIEKFLGLAPAFSADMFVFNATKGFNCLNVTHPLYRLARDKPRNMNKETGCFKDNKGRKHTPYSKLLFTKVVNAVQEHNRELFELIGEEFDWTKPEDIFA